MVSGAGSFPEVGTACGNRTDGSGDRGQVLAPAGRYGGRCRCRSSAVGGGNGRRRGNAVARVILGDLRGGQLTHEIAMDITGIGIAVFTGRIGSPDFEPMNLLCRFVSQDLTDVISRQFKSDLLVGSGAVAQVDLVQCDAHTNVFGIGRNPAAGCGRDQRDQHAQRQSKTKQAAAIHGHEWFTSVNSSVFGTQT